MVKNWKPSYTERHLPYEIVYCYLPPAKGERAPP